MGIIYKHTINGKHYIGQTVGTLEDRLTKHIDDANKGSEFHFHRAIRKYGESSITSQILEIVDQQDLSEREKFFIEKFNTFEEGYNMTKGGEGGNTRLKFSQERLSKYHESISKGNLGKKRTKQTKELLSKIKLDNPTRNIGKNNGRSRNFILIKPDGSEITIENGWVNYFNENSIPKGLIHYLNLGRIKNSRQGALDGYEFRDKFYNGIKECDAGKNRNNGRKASFRIIDKSGKIAIESNTSLKEISKKYNFLYSTLKSYLGEEIPPTHQNSRNKSKERINCEGIKIEKL